MTAHFKRSRRSKKKSAPKHSEVTRFGRVNRVLKELPVLEKRIQKVANAKFVSPSFQRMQEASSIVRQYIIKHKRKVYGGLAIDNAIKEKDPSLALYSTEDYADYDFYSSEALQDVQAICKLLVDAGFQAVLAEGAVHDGTYKIRAEFYDKEVCDISYVWSRYYNKIPAKVAADGIVYVLPQYQAIDLYRPFCDFASWHKIAKNIYRAAILEHFYLKFRNPNPHKQFKSQQYQADIQEVRNTVLKFLTGRTDVVLLDCFAYNAMVSFSKVDRIQERLVPLEDVKIYVAGDAEALMLEVVKAASLEPTADWTIQMFHPLLEHHRGAICLTVKTLPVLTVYLENFCLPYQVHDGFQMGSFHLVLRFLYIMRFHHMVKGDHNQSSRYTYMILHLQYAREQYLVRHGMTGVEPGLLQELQDQCLGDSFENLQIAWRKKKVLQHSTFYYKASATSSVPKEYKQPNTSGSMFKEILADGTVRKPLSKSS